MNSSETLAPTVYWQEAYKDTEFEYSESKVGLKDLYEKYLSMNGTCFEIGCYPGQNLVYLGMRFNYVVSGIDIVSFMRERVSATLSKHGVRIGDLIVGDFLEFTATEKYDVVCSFGFIEHFKNTEDIIRRHVDLLKPGGILVMTSPNFRRAQYLLHSWIDPDNLARHNINAMDFEKWRTILSKYNMDILYQNYYGTAGFWAELPPGDKSIGGMIKKTIALVLEISFKMISKFVDHPNSALSVHMVSISKKRGQITYDKHLL